MKNDIKKIYKNVTSISDDLAKRKANIQKQIEECEKEIADNEAALQAAAEGDDRAAFEKLSMRTGFAERRIEILKGKSQALGINEGDQKRIEESAYQAMHERREEVQKKLQAMLKETEELLEEENTLNDCANNIKETLKRYSDRQTTLRTDGFLSVARLIELQRTLQKVIDWRG